MKKGVNALEVVFGVFLLIIVVFVVMRLITNFVRPEKVTAQLQGFNEAYKFSEEQAACNSLCENYNVNNCNKRDAVDYCLKKVKIDIDGNKNPGEKGHGGFVRNLPYCEDGLYCFHITDCYCGSYKLDASTCLQILCDYYVYEEGISFEDAVKIINTTQGIHWGSCNLDPKTWSKDKDYQPPTNLKTDWWFKTAGYNKIETVCTNTVS